MYFANLPEEEILPKLKEKVSAFEAWAKQSGYLDKVKANYSAFYSLGVKGSVGIEKNEDGSILNVAINHHRNILKNMSALLTQSKISYFVKANNGDTDAIATSVIGKGALDQASEEKDLDGINEKLLKRALVVLDAFVEVEWDETLGEEIAGDVETGEIIYAGDNQIHIYTGLQVARPTTSTERLWLIPSRRTNRYELAKRFPEHADYIENFEETRSGLTLDFKMNFDHSLNQEASDDVTMYTFIHKPCRVVPDGMIVRWVGDKIIEYDTESLKKKYKRMNIEQFQCEEVIESVGSHSPGVDLIAIQEVLNALFTAAVTNNINLAITDVYSEDPNTTFTRPPGSKGMRLWTGTKPPTGVNFAQSSPELYNLIQLMIGQGTQISGQNELVRGNVQNVPNLKSGNALALLIVEAIRYVSDIQRTRARVASWIGHQIIINFQRNAKEDHLALIGGQGSKSYIKKFKGSDLYGIEKVTVELQNPIMSTQGGREQMANNMLEKQLFDNPKSDYVHVFTTGELPSTMADTLSEEQGIAEENEFLRAGKQVKVHILDKHEAHVPSHKQEINDPAVRNDPIRLKTVQDHIQSHLDNWKKKPPELCMMLGHLAYDPNQFPPPPPAAGAQVDVPAGETMDPSQLSGAGNQPLPKLPNLPNSAPPESVAQMQQYQAAAGGNISN